MTVVCMHTYKKYGLSKKFVSAIIDSIVLQSLKFFFTVLHHVGRSSQAKHSAMQVIFDKYSCIIPYKYSAALHNIAKSEFMYIRKTDQCFSDHLKSLE